MLQGKYLKYTEDITLEIFTKIIERLNKTGWKHLIGDSIDNQFNKFTNDGYLIYCSNKDDYSFYTENAILSTDVELKVSDILGEETKFEVGGWYRSKSWATLYLNPSRNEVIWSSGEFEKSYESNENINDWLLLTDLSEIQQYLPDNHPDKIVKPIEKWSVGSYVVFCKDGGHGQPIGKIDKIVEDVGSFGRVELLEYGSCATTREVIDQIKWFATLPEAEAFSKSLLEPKEPKTLTINDLVEGEIYYCLNNTICKWGKKDSIYSINSNEEFWSEPGSYSGEYNFRPATPEEKKWLNVCIAEDKFIEKDYALRGYDMYGKPLKSEVIPEYVELLKGWSQEEEFVGEIFDTKQDFQEQFKKFKGIGHSWNWNFILTEPNHKKYFKESTKAAYDAQFKKEMKEEFKVGDWVYADRQSKGDFRYELGDSYIPIFKVKEILRSSKNNNWLRPVKNRANGIEGKYCRLATPEEIAKVTKPKTKPFEFNKWYKFLENGLVFITSETTGYGFNNRNRWFVRTEGSWRLDNMIPATDEEVSEKLIAYAKEKYPVGTKFKELNHPYSLKEFNETEFNYYPEQDQLTCGQSIYIGGKWAEVISKPETKESKEFDRNWYVEVNSQEEADKVFDWLESQGEKIDRKWNEFSNLWKYIVIQREDPVWILTCDNICYKRGFIEKQLLDILPEYKQSIKTEEELSLIFDTNEDLRKEIKKLIDQRDFKSSDFAEPIVIKNKKQKRNKLIIVNN